MLCKVCTRPSGEMYIRFVSSVIALILVCEVVGFDIQLGEKGEAIVTASSVLVTFDVLEFESRHR